MDHNILALKTKTCEYKVNPEWETKFQIGDSISKKLSWLFIEHYRDGELIEILNYRDLAKNLN